MGRAKVLLYRLGEESAQGRLLRAILREKKILTLSVSEAQLEETVERLVSTNAAAAGHAPAQAPEIGFMLLCELGDRQLDRLLAEMRRAGVSVPYKAVLTEQNRTWTLGRLIGEVAREHETLRAGGA